jgi:hypothetical protein
MDLIRARVTFRERSLLDVADLAVRFCAANWAAYARLGLVVLLPAFVACLTAQAIGGWPFAWCVAIVTSALADAPFLALASKLVFADEATVGDALRAAGAAAPVLCVVRGLQAIALLLSGVLLLLPWIWIGSTLLFLPEVVILERLGIAAAWARAGRVARAHLGAATAAMLLLAALTVGSAVVGDMAGREILERLLELKAPPSMFEAGGSVLALLGYWSTLPLRATIRFFVYLDVRTRTEGWDIQTRFAAIAAREA